MAVLWELALLALIIYFPALRNAFGTEDLLWVDWVIVALLVHS